MAVCLIRIVFMVAVLGTGTGLAWAQGGSLLPPGISIQSALESLRGSPAESPLAADAKRLVDILETQRADFLAEFELRAARLAELEAAVAARPAGYLPASAEQLAKRDALRARASALDAVQADNPAADALRAHLERFIARANDLDPVLYPAQRFDTVMALHRVRNTVSLHAGPAATFPSQAEIPEDTDVLMLATERGGAWRLIVVDDLVGYVQSSDLEEF